MVNLPGETDRSVSCGASGSGKTTGLKYILAPFYGTRQIIVLDTKMDPSYDKLDAVFVKRGDTLSRYADPERYPLVIYRPNAQELNVETLDSVLDWCYRRGNNIVVIDEASQVCGGSHNAGIGLLNAVTRGRVKGVSVFSGTQRPVGIPAVLFSEAEWVYCYALRRKNDRKTVDDYTKDGFADAVLREAEKAPNGHPVGVYRMGRGGRIYPSIQDALLDRRGYAV